MIELRLACPDARPLRLLALGAHPDDVEIACGGTLLSAAEAHPGLRAHVVVLTGSPERAAEAQTSAPSFMLGGVVTVDVHDLPDGRLPAYWEEVKELLEQVAASFLPDVIFAPRRDDAHQDHQMLGELVQTVWRNHLVLGYEIPKYDGNLGPASAYMPLSERLLQEKVRLLHKAFPSQIKRDWFDDDAFFGLARLRGVECRQRYAEAFVAAKATVTW